MPRKRLEAFLKWAGWSDSELARQVLCHQTYARRVRLGEANAGLAFAVMVERITGKWPRGPIRADEWIAKDGGFA